MSPLFRRRGRDGADEPAEGLAPEATEADEAGPEDAADEADASPADAFDRSGGPWDVAEVDSTEGYVDLGALLVKGRDGMELRLEVDEAADRVTSATVQLAGSAVQLQVFAAPRTEGIWDEIRTEIAAGISRQGGTADEVPGVFGRELIARIPVRTSDGRTGHQPARFAGVDGPRWFLRAVFHGAAVADPDAAGDVEAVVRDLVVVRGPEAMAPRELLSLRLPQQPQAAAEAAEDADDAEDGGAPAREPLDPFTRGPEITEIR